MDRRKYGARGQVMGNACWLCQTYLLLLCSRKLSLCQPFGSPWPNGFSPCPEITADSSLVLFSQRLGSLHFCAAEWSERFILSALYEDEANRDALLSRFFLNPVVHDERLFEVLKPTMTGLATREIQSQSYLAQGVGHFCVLCWLARREIGTRWLSDHEFRRVLIYGCDTLRTHVLWIRLSLCGN